MDQRDLKELVSMIGFRMLQNYNKQNIYYNVRLESKVDITVTWFLFV